MENNEIKVEKSLDEMLDHLNSINDDFINNYFEEEKENSNNKQLDIEKELEDFYEKTDNFEPSSKRLFGLEEPIKKVNPEVDDIMSLIDASTTGEEFFNKIEGEFFD